MQQINRQARAIALMIILGLSTAACGWGTAHGSTDPITLVIVPKANTMSYWSVVKDGALCAASMQPQVSIHWDGVAAENDVTDQITMLQHYITQRPDGIVYAATNAQALAQVSAQATGAHIPVFNIDSGTVPQSGNVPLFATDNTAAATKAADIMAHLLQGHGQIAVIPFEPGSATNDQRIQGFTQELAKYGNVHIVATESSDSNVTTAEHVTQALLVLHPEITGIFAANEAGTLGAATAINLAGLSGKIQIVGWDSSPEEISSLQNGTITALVVQNPFKMGYDSVIAMVKLLRQHIAPANEDTGVTFITRQNMQDPAVQALLHPSCKTPPIKAVSP